MKEDAVMTKISTNIISYLFAAIACPKCGERSLVSLEMLRDKEQVSCPHCRKTFRFIVGDTLGDFAVAFHRLYEHLKKISPYLVFSHRPSQKGRIPQ